MPHLHQLRKDRLQLAVGDLAVIVCDFSSQTTRWILVGLGAVALLCVFLLANLWRVTRAASRR